MGQEDVRAPFRIGVVGLGSWAEKYFSTCSGIPGLEIVAASRRSDSPVPGYASDTPVFRDWSDMLDVGIDGLIVAAHPSAHLGVLKTCAEAGIPVMLEKPMALSLADAEAISDLTFSAPVLVNHVHLFSPAFEKIRSMVMQRANDPLRIVSCGAGPGPVRDYSSLWDYGPHDVSMCLSLLEEDRPAVTSESTVGDNGSTHRIRMSAGFLDADVTVSNLSPEKIRILRVEFDNHVAIYDDRSSVKLRLDGVPVQVSHDPPLARAVRAFLEASLFGVSDWRFGPEIGLNVCRVLGTSDKP